MNSVAIHTARGSVDSAQVANITTAQGVGNLTDAKLHMMPAPAHTSTLQWQLFSLQERRELLAEGSNSQAFSGGNADAEEVSPLALLGRTVQQRFRVGQLQTPSANSVAGDVAKNTGEQAALDDITDQFKSRFSGMANDKEAFHDVMRKTYGDSYDVTAAEGMRQKALKDDFSWMPKVELVDAATLTDVSDQSKGQGLGAYSKENDTVYLSRDLLSSDPAKVEKILTEEIGHAIDTRVNVGDAEGDEGDLFARQIYGEKISAAELTQLKQENDSGVINVNGKEVEVEFILNKIRDRVKDAFKSARNSVKNAADKLVDGAKNIVDKAVDAVKDAGSAVVDTVKKGIKKIVTNPFVAKIMAVAQFIPIPIVQAVTLVYSLAKGGYAVYQGIKNKSWEVALSGFASVAGGMASVGKMIGASAGFVNGAARVANNAQMAVSINQAVNNKDWTALAGMLPENGDGILSSLKPFVEKARVGSVAYDAARNGDYLGAIGVGAGLLTDFTSTQGDSVLNMIGSNAKTASAIRQAITSGDYSAAADLISKQYGDNLSLSPVFRERLSNFSQTVENVNKVQQLIENKDYAAAAQLLQETANHNISSPETRERIETASQVVQKIDTAVKAFNDGRHVDAIKISSEALGYPLDDKTEQFLVDLKQTSQELETAKKLGESGDYANAAQVLIDAAKIHVSNSDVRERLTVASETFQLVDNAKNAVNEGRYDDAIDVISEILERPLDEKTRQFLSNLEKVVEDFQDVDNMLRRNISSAMG